MGHERLGMLPKTRRWQAIVSDVASGDVNAAHVSRIAAATLNALGKRYVDLAGDESVRSAFTFLVELARDAKGPASEYGLANRNPLALVSDLSARTRATNGSLEVREIANRAAADAIAAWYVENGAQADLFGDLPPKNRWKGLETGAGFCELSRRYFSKLTERYLAYFLEREISAALPNLSVRDDFQKRLNQHIGDVSRHSFETAKITQSFAAGWFNKNVLYGSPTDAEVRRFLSHAFSKLREDLRREDKR